MLKWIVLASQSAARFLFFFQKKNPARARKREEANHCRKYNLSLAAWSDVYRFWVVIYVSYEYGKNCTVYGTVDSQQY